MRDLLDIDKVLDMPAKTISRNDEKRTYRKLLKGRFDVKVCRIDREDDKNTVSGKHSDFSTLTIRSLMERGKEDAIKSVQNCYFSKYRTFINGMCPVINFNYTTYFYV